MKHEFLVSPPRLNQAFESEGSSGRAWGNGITRRTFIKRTGGATVASLVVWNVATQKAQASETLGASVPASVPEAVVWKKFKVTATITISGSGATPEQANKDLDKNAKDLNLSGPGHSTFTGEQKKLDVSNMTPCNPPWISSVNGVGCTPTRQPDGTYKSTVTLVYDPIHNRVDHFLEWYYK